MALMAIRYELCGTKKYVFWMVSVFFTNTNNFFFLLTALFILNKYNKVRVSKDITGRCKS